MHQSYRSVDAAHGKRRRHANDNFCFTSLAIAKDELNAELEITGADTGAHHFGWDNIQLTGRYSWTNDVVGDPVTIVTGLTLRRAWKQAVNDLSSFHHGRTEGEIHVAAGKEFVCEQFWMSRMWGLFAIGTADKGSPWLRSSVNWECNWWDRHEVRLSVRGLCGLGGNGLNLNKPFRGYGPIRHRSLDFAVRYSYFVETLDGRCELEYSHRVYAKNFPKNANCILATFHYAFGL